ncbi:MgtC/SapB family protein [Thermoleptolyngbya sp. C42_A2020_037]|uniref:MgtC/SapB family protein n=1 Tax=Thermoleptolyngbya sp. C42_A2020_037 TaxID=2747799 RepID=UPI0019F69F9C|nr:MgtC/SapB family protein [Thermoleptolyngbya sp. C42_A2020_037]MBF2082992.1 MgtC/SapB family protein [Thermoleptolyngbya sp. C42_A2020_037]
MTWTECAIRLAVAFLLGSALGLERQWRQRMAGLRTNTLVATGAALFVMLSVLTPGDASPTRVAAQVVSGIGFLGGGVILREGLTVRGLNTAATLWCAAAIGSLSGAGLLPHAAMGTAAVLVANLLLRPLGYRINQQPLKGTELELCYRCEVVCRAQDEAHVRALLLQAVASGKLRLRSLYSEDLEDKPDRVNIEAELVTQERNDAFMEQVVSRLSLEPGVIATRWRIIEQEFG